MLREAIISPCGKHRYLLRRVWDDGRPRLLFVMLNPSTADAETDDPTIRSCIRLATANGFGSIEVVNLYSFRATKPADLEASTERIGVDNERITMAAIARCDLVVCAWGAHPLARLSQFTLGHLRSRKPAVHCFGRTKSGAPRHPLYLRTDTPLEVYR